MPDHRDSTDHEDGADTPPPIPDADPPPTDASQYSTAEEEVVTEEDRDADDRDA